MFVYINTLSDIIASFQRTKPGQISLEIERLHQEAKRLELAYQYVDQINKELQGDIEMIDEELDRQSTQIKENEKLGILTMTSNDVF